MQTEPQKEHRWLDRLVGEWTYEEELQPGEDRAKSTGTETVRSLGGLWVVAEGQGPMPGGDMGTTVMTLGFDRRKGRYTGTWVGSMMDHLWIYDGAVDGSGNVLALASKGPSMKGDGQMVNFKDVIEFKSDDHRLLIGNFENEDGTWTEMVRIHYHRRK